MVQVGFPRQRYPARRIALHWIAATLLLAQWLTADAVHRTHGTLLPPRRADLIEFALHRYAGIALGWVVLGQLIMRLSTPAPPPVDAGWRRALAAAVHWGLIGVILAQAVTGVVAIYVAPVAARVHGALWNGLLLLLALHVAGVLFHLGRRDGALRRILPPLPTRRIR